MRAAGEAMRDWYDAPKPKDVSDEQANVLPGGLLGIVKVPDIRLSDCHPSALAKPLMWLSTPESSPRDRGAIRYENPPVTSERREDCAFHWEKTLFDFRINRVQPGQVDRFSLILS